MRSVLALLLLATAVCVCVEAASKHVSSKGYEAVTYGSMVKLVNQANAAHLHSHEVKYGSGSQQQSVTGKSESDDPNSYWLVRAQHGQFATRGEPVKCNSIIRLQHQNTKRNLHSHNFLSPLSNSQEVSAFGENGNGDEGDNWKLECLSGTVWTRDEKVRFKHVATGKYLHCTGKHQYGRPIAGQQEICASTGARNENIWAAEGGVFIAPTRDD